MATNDPAVVLHAYGFGACLVAVDAPCAHPGVSYATHAEGWRQAHRLSREMGWRGTVRIIRHEMFPSRGLYSNCEEIVIGSK